MKVQTIRAMSLYVYAGILCMLALFADCGQGGASGGSASGTKITVDISGAVPPPPGLAPPSVALKVGTGSFTPIMAQSNQQVSFTVPSLTEPYALAWECFIIGPHGLPEENSEVVFESTAQDATSYGVDCDDAVKALDLSSIPGFFALPSSGTNVTWQGVITGGSVAAGPVFFPTTPTGGSSVEVFNGGSYVVP